jgi:deoxyribonuclease-4
LVPPEGAKVVNIKREGNKVIGFEVERDGKIIGKTARENNVNLSIHAPYFINLCQTDVQKVKNTKQMIIDSLDRGRLMEAKLIVFHPGAYGKHSKEEAFERAKEVLEEIRKRAADEDRRYK